MTRKSKANKEKRYKEPEVERFRSLEELNYEFGQRKNGGFKSLSELTKQFQDQKEPDGETTKTSHFPVTEELTHATYGTGVLKKIFEGRGFGFIAPDQDHGAGDVFLHFSDITGGGARNLGIGTWVRYDIEPDVASGRLRAKNVSVLPSTPSTAASETAALSIEVVDLPPSSTACAYNRDVMLGIFKALVVCSYLEKAPSLKLSTVPMPSSSAGRGDQEDPCLDDERLLARLEERLDKETGADALNMQTFGACSGWTYEEAVAANEKLRIASDVDELMDLTTTDGSFSSTKSEDSASRSDTSEDRRESRQEVPSGDEPRPKDDTWSWEEACHQAKLLEDHRQTWEVEQKQMLEAGPLLVFQ